MKKTLLLLMLFSVCISAQQIVIADSIEQMNEQLIGKIYYDPITNKLVMKNRTGAITQTLDISGSFVNRSDFNLLKDDVTNHINSNYTVNFGTGWTDFTDFAVKLFPNWNSVTQSFDYELYPISLDEFLGEYAVTISNMRQDIKDLKDSLAQLANFIWGGGGIVHAYPQYAFYYKPINFGANVTSDTVIQRWIKNNGTANMSVSYRSTSPFYLQDSSGGVVPAGDSIKVYFRFKIGEAVIDQSYDVNVFISHNGGGTTGTSTTDTISCQGKWILTVNPDPTVADYYVSNTGTVGRDNGSGTIDDPFLTLVKGISMLGVGQTLALARGSTFNENVTINKDSITIIAYGTGLKPVITSIDSVSGAMNGNNWSEYSTNVWVMDFPETYLIERFWINGTEVYMAESRSGINSTYKTFHNNSAGKLYLYSTSNPASNYTSIQYPGSGFYTMQIKGDNITIDGIDIRGGKYASVGLAGSDNLIIKNSKLGYGGGKSAVMCNGYQISSSDGTTNNVTLLKDTIDSGRDYPYTWYRSGIGWGVYIGDNTSDWLVDSCVISNYAMGIDIDGNYNSPAENHIIRNSEIYNNNTWTLGKGIQMFQSSIDGTGLTQNNSVYNNYIHNLGGAGIAVTTSGNKIYYNIIDSIFEGTNAHVVGNGGFGIEYAREDSWSGSNNYIFNNTIYKTHKEAISYNSGNVIENNLLIENSLDRAYPLAIWISAVNSNYYNNCFYRTGFNADNWVVEINFSPYTVAQFNGYANASGNFYSTESSLANLITVSTWNLPSGSDALNAGIDIDALLPDGFKDRNGNTVNQTTPNVGAIDN